MASSMAKPHSRPIRTFALRRRIALDRHYALITACVMLSICLLIGGGGPHSPFSSMLTEASAIIVIAIAMAKSHARQGYRLSRPAWLIVAAILVLIFYQLVPLPATWWTAMPGRALLANAMTVVLGGVAAHPMSIDPRATADMAIAVLVPIAAFVITGRVAPEKRLLLAAIIVSFALAAVLIEGLQFAGALSNFFVREGPGSLPTGLFANHNHQAALQAIAITLLVPLGEWSLQRYRTISVLVVALSIHSALLIGVIATQSRGGAILTFLASLWAGFSYWRWWRRHLTLEQQGGAVERGIGRTPDNRRRAIYVLSIAALGLAAIAGLMTSTPVQQFVGRFSDLEDKRVSYLPDLWDATSAFLPWGSGFGSYPIVFQSYESLDRLSPTFFNHAHNDYFELLMEGGLPAMAVLGAFVLFLLYSIFVVFFGERRNDRMAQASVVAVLLVMTHSVLDYPLRTYAIAAVFGVLIANIATRNRPLEQAS